MILKIQEYFARVKPVTIEGLLYVAIAVCGFLATVFGSDESFNLFGPMLLFWVKLVNGSILAAATALKMFRSNTFAEHVQEKKIASGDTAVVTKTTVQQEKIAV